MITYHKINSIYKRDKKGVSIEGQYSIPEFELLKNIDWYWDEKIDGTNIRVIFNHQSDKFEFKGKKEKSKIPVFLLEALETKFNNTKMIEQYKITFPKYKEKEIVLFGEGYGNKIQSVGKDYIEKGNDFVLFDININGNYLSRIDRDLLGEELNLYCPYFFRRTLQDAINYVKNNPISIISENRKLIMEGLVGVPVGEFKTRAEERIIIKIKHKDFIKI